jgi:hypothetical protein
MAIKTAWFWHKNRYKKQWNTAESTDRNPWNYPHQIFEKGAKTYDGEKTASSTNFAWRTGFLHAENWS